MRATPLRLGLVVMALGLLLAGSLVLSMGLGSAGVGLGDAWDLITGRGGDPAIRAIFLSYRLPRTLLAALAGASLSLSGVVFQALLRNPLAEPFILGVSGGAAAGAVTALSLGLTSLIPQSGLAFLGALGAMFIVFGLARRRGGLDSGTLILTGVMVNAFFTAIIMYVISTTTDQKLHAIMFWLYGDLGGSNLDNAVLLAPPVLLGTILIYWFSRELNLLAAGETAAASLGVPVERVKLILYALVSLLAGTTVSLTGVIGFVGLMVPHLLRLILGNDHRVLLAAAALGGAAFLVLADTAARLIISPSSLPVGVVTAALGAPFFLLLLARRRSPWW